MNIQRLSRTSRFKVNMLVTKASRLSSMSDYSSNYQTIISDLNETNQPAIVIKSLISQIKKLPRSYKGIPLSFYGIALRFATTKNEADLIINQMAIRTRTNCGTKKGGADVKQIVKQWFSFVASITT